MTCREIAEFLSDFLSNELPEAVRADFVSHVVICQDCQRYMDSFQKTIELGQGAFDPMQEAAKMPESLVQAILRAKS